MSGGRGGSSAAGPAPPQQLAPSACLAAAASSRRPLPRRGAARPGEPRPGDGARSRHLGTNRRRDRHKRPQPTSEQLPCGVTSRGPIKAPRRDARAGQPMAGRCSASGRDAFGPDVSDHLFRGAGRRAAAAAAARWVPQGGCCRSKPGTTSRRGQPSPPPRRGCSLIGYLASRNAGAGPRRARPSLPGCGARCAGAWSAKGGGVGRGGASTSALSPPVARDWLGSRASSLLGGAGSSLLPIGRSACPLRRRGR